MPEISLASGIRGIWIVAIGIVSLGAVLVGYRRAFRAISPERWLALVSLRVLAVGLVLLLLARPILTFSREQTQRRALVLLVDRSASMSVSDRPGGGTRWEHARDTLMRWWPLLERDFDVQCLLFSDVTQVLPDAGALARVAPDGAATSLVRAVTDAGGLAKQRPTEAVILITDGVHNAQGDPIAAAGRAGVVVHTIGVGNVLRDRRDLRDIQVVGIDCPHPMSLQNLARVSVQVDATGYPGRLSQVVLFEDDIEVARGEITLDDVPGGQDVTLEFRPTKKGLHRYNAAIPPAPDERIPQNNQRATSALVVESRIRVLYIEGTLRAEYGAVVGQFLAKDPDIEYVALVQTRPGVFVQRSNRTDMTLNKIPDSMDVWQQFDVVILGDLDSSFLQSGQIADLRRRVEQGGGLMLLGGYHSLGPGGYGETALADISPLILGDRNVGQIDSPFALQLTVAGQQHPIFANIGPFFPTASRPAEVAGLPELTGCVRNLGASPAAVVLATHPTETAGDELLPVLAVRTVGEGRVAAFAGDTTRNWHQMLRAQDRESPFLRFWGQSIRWLAGRTEQVQTEAGISATTDRVVYDPGAEVTIDALVRGERGEGTTSARVTAQASGPDGESISLELAPVPGPAGHFSIKWEPQRAGRYTLRVRADIESQTLEAEPMAIEIGRPKIEFEQLELDQQRLESIAEVSHGMYMHLDTADRLLDLLHKQVEREKVEWEMSVAWPPLCWLLFVVLLMTEWTMRRRYQLR